MLYISHDVLLKFTWPVQTQPFFRLIDKNSQDNHHAYGNELPERINTQEDQAILDDRNNQRADHRADDGAFTTQERGATDNHRSDRAEKDRVTHIPGPLADAQP